MSRGDHPMSRLPVDPVSRLPSVQSFGELSQFLRSSVADEECLQMSDSMGVVSAHIERIAAFLQHPKNADNAAELASLLFALLTALRTHQRVVDDLGEGWRSQFEYRSYVSLLNYFRNLVGQWTVDAQPVDQPPLTAVEFELNAWRLLGGGALLIDVYEQSLFVEPEWRPQETKPFFARVRGWLGL